MKRTKIDNGVMILFAFIVGLIIIVEYFTELNLDTMFPGSFALFFLYFSVRAYQEKQFSRLIIWGSLAILFSYLVVTSLAYK
ncbi:MULTISPECIES: hypothetical protein [Enterococcus]|uniref:hypothetical protein n=1 Tax=Enterococcus TaxID=1350 RepID=UPI00065E044C|nr:MULTISPECIES: hypothetical protein [Enterococcus]KAF1303860.1 hypothetical protein BAU16_03235 [Enterococcus sp. JM9B]